MLLVPISIASNSSRSIVPSSLIISHVSGTGFLINNYDASASYFLSAGSLAGDTISLGMSVPATIYAKYPKGISSTSTISLERREITYTTAVFNLTNWYSHPAPCHIGDTCYGDCTTGDCGHPEGYWTYDGEDSPPPGFVKSDGEWIKIQTL